LSTSPYRYSEDCRVYYPSRTSLKILTSAVGLFG
jgi:hypothetical protein